MDKLFERYKLPKLIQEQIDNINNSTSIKEIEFVYKPSHKENTGPIWLRL